jgi:hypothetical protein
MKKIKHVDASGTVHYFKDHSYTNLHNEEGPAIIYKDGQLSFYIDNCRLSVEVFKEKDLEAIRHTYPKLYPHIVQYLAERYL